MILIYDDLLNSDKLTKPTYMRPSISVRFFFPHFALSQPKGTEQADRTLYPPFLSSRLIFCCSLLFMFSFLDFR